MRKLNNLEPINFDYLLDDTRSVLDTLCETAPFLPHYSLVGGSALALYLRHRKSEDLDFFTYEDSFDRQQILAYINRFNRYEVLNDNSDQLDVLLDGVKVTFFNAKWAFLRPASPISLNIASLTSIAAMKTNVLFMRAKFRDYYDLYFLVKKGMTVTEIFESAHEIVGGLTFKLFCIALLYIDDVADDTIDHLDPEENLTKVEIRYFFEKQIQAIMASG